MTTPRSRRLSSLLALALLAGCDIAGCDREPPVPSGELDRLGDIVLLTPPESDRSFVVVTNPEIAQLRVFDVLERRFVPAPNLFFPLSARTGPATRRLAVSPVDQRFVYALDGAADHLQVIAMLPTVEIDSDTVAPAFTTSAVFETRPAPSDVAVWSSGVEGELPLAFIALPGESAVEVLALDLEGQTIADSLLIDLGEGSVPNRLEVDPTGDAVVVTDAALDSVAIVRVRPDVAGAPLAALDRRIDVGGPTSDVSIGVVNPGDGLGPLALVALRDLERVAAVRLFREGFREDRYALLGSVEIPDLASSLYVPDQRRDTPRACCAEPTATPDTNDPTEPATLAWGTVATANGFIYYVRFDARRRGGGRLVRLIDFGTQQPGPVDDLNDEDEFWFPVEGGENRAPTVEVTPVDNFGDPPVVPLLRSPNPRIDLEYEGSPPGTVNRRAVLLESGGAFTLEVVAGAVPFAERDVRLGDELVIDTSDRGGSCPDEVRATVEGVSGDEIAVSPLSALAAACVSQGDTATFTLFAVGDFLVTTTDHGYQGRLPLTSETTSIEVPAFRVSVSRASAGPPLRGSRLSIEVTQDIRPASIFLSEDILAGGLGSGGLLPEGIVGGSVRLRDLDGNVSVGSRTFVATGTGSLLLFEEGATALRAGDVVSYFD